MPAAKRTEVAIFDEDEGIDFVPVEILGEKYQVRKGTNYFALLNVFNPDEPGNLPKYLIDRMARVDRNRFITAMSRRAELDMDDLLKIFNDITEAQADGRPSRSSSGSSTGSAKKAASTRSADT